jgi:hypothetical protein
MPCGYTISKELRLIVRVAWGVVTFAEMVAHQDRLRGDPEFSPQFDQLIDATAVSRVEATAGEMRSLALVSPFSSSSRCAFVANSAGIYGVGRMMMTLSELSPRAYEMAIFKDLPSALKWLGVKALPEPMRPESVKLNQVGDPAKRKDIA